MVVVFVVLASGITLLAVRGAFENVALWGKRAGCEVVGIVGWRERRGCRPAGAGRNFMAAGQWAPLNDA